MLEIFALAYTGRKFKELAENYNKTPWKVILSAVGLYILFALIAVILVYIIFSDVDPLVLSLISLPVGLSSCYGLYYYLENKWKKEPSSSINEIEKIGTKDPN